jgi:hypothetical protein
MHNPMAIIPSRDVYDPVVVELILLLTAADIVPLSRGIRIVTGVCAPGTTVKDVFVHLFMRGRLCSGRHPSGPKRLLFA